MKKKKVNWQEAIQPLLDLYKEYRHPLEYKNNYQLLIMTILAGRDRDDNINALAPALFKAFPDMKKLASATAEDLHPYIKKVRSFSKKAEWIIAIAKQIKTNKNIPLTLDELVALPGIGRKSAHVIMREAGVPLEGIMVDLHVVRVAPRLGIAEGENPEQIEKQIMEQLSPEQWTDAGMAMSFLGRETCRPKEPQQEECIMNKVCAYYKVTHSKK